MATYIRPYTVLALFAGVGRQAFGIYLYIWNQIESLAVLCQVPSRIYQAQPFDLQKKSAAALQIATPGIKGNSKVTGNQNVRKCSIIRSNIYITRRKRYENTNVTIRTNKHGS